MATNSELAERVIKALVSLKLDLAAHVSVLRNSVLRDHEGRVLDWKDTVKTHRGYLDSNKAEDLHSDVSQRFLAAKLLSAESLQALLDLIERKTPLEEPSTKGE